MNENDSPLALGTGNIKKLLFTYAWPAIVSQMAASLYNIIDRIFIGQGVGATAISGLAITFPLMNFGAAFGAMVGVGCSALVSIKLGQNDKQSAENILGHAVVLNVILGVLLMIFGLIFITPILYFFGASDQTLPYAKDYMVIILLGNIVTHLYLGLNNVMRSSGYPQKAMYTTFLTVVINAVLDPLFIFTFGWGIQGAAIATILSQIVALIYVIYHFSKKESFIHFKKGIYRLKKQVVSGIFAIGVSPFVMHACGCLVVIIFNNSLKFYGGDIAIGAYGIINGVLMLFIMVNLGIAQGMQPIAGFNYGAQKYDRVVSVFKYASIAATVVTTIAFLLCEIFPQTIARLFTTDKDLIVLTTDGLRIAIAGFPVVGFAVIVGNFFQSIGHAAKSVFLSATRQMLFLIPLLLLLPLFLGLNGVWLSMPISDVISAIMAMIFCMLQLKSLRKKELNKNF